MARLADEFTYKGMDYKRIIKGEQVSVYKCVANENEVDGAYYYLAEEDMVCFDVIANFLAEPMPDDPSVVYVSDNDFYMAKYADTLVADRAFEQDIFLEAVDIYRKLSSHLGSDP